MYVAHSKILASTYAIVLNEISLSCPSRLPSVAPHRAKKARKLGAEEYSNCDGGRNPIPKRIQNVNLIPKEKKGIGVVKLL